MMKKHIQAVAVVSAIIFSQAAMAQGTKNAPVISDAEGPIKIINLYDLEKEASTKVAKGAFGYVEGGAEDEVTMRSNSTAFDKKKILPNGLAGIDGVNLKTTFLGVELASPIIIAPMAAHGLVHKEADRATIRGTQKAGTLMAVSTYSSVPIDDIAKSAPGAPFVFQLYMSKDNAYNEYIVKKAKAAGAKAIIITIDAGTAGNREADARNNYNYSVATPNVSEFYKGKNITQSQARALRKISFSGEDIKFIKRVSGLPVLVKGVLSPQAAETAIAAGADGIWISNHGGRQLDGAPATFDMLPIIAKTVNKRVPIIFDSGVRRGTHVFKALASGADIVAIGRPALYGLILGGSEGVNDVFQQLNKELTTTMILAGTKDIEAVKQNKLFDPEKQEAR
ncbi:alpha-hydroxy-acid oxidizing protein [Oxalobacter vibrioformis]|uniref:Alpha-hydroxy-acid oxidizing protein n=1 Tax=Oxalobacter vibrioformis TaxID=933080 RepID=A0A9E9LVD7_9BURK|nr:alpha-hydroxy-acid oxidizing protein [Oxalobacter vibrioformis]WAW10415.1 alpha-hydroxy-acid oxidizing protein [Oxalobacter vibrioformis]